MKSKVIISAVALAVLSASTICAADSKEEKQSKIRQGVSQTLQDLYKLQPAAQGAIQKAAGYAVFKTSERTCSWSARRVARVSPPTIRPSRTPS